MLTLVRWPSNIYECIESILDCNSFGVAINSIIFVALATVEILIVLIDRIKAESIGNEMGIAVIISWTEPCIYADLSNTDISSIPRPPILGKLISICHVSDSFYENSM